MAQQQDKRRSNVGQDQQGRDKSRQGGQGGQPGQSGQRGQQGQAGQHRSGDNPRSREEDTELEEEE